MDKIIDYLKQLELSDIEARIYLALLKTGPMTVRDLAKAIKIKRTTAYVYVDQLVEKSLLVKLVKGSLKQVAASEPQDSLQELVQRKVESAKTVQKDLPEMLKTLIYSLPQVQDTDEAEIKYYKGKNGVKKIYKQVLQAKEQRSYVDTKKIVEVFPENFDTFNQTLTTRPNVKMYEIFQNYSKENTELYLKHITKHENYFYKILPEGIQLTAQDILIYDNNVAIVTFNDEINGVVLQNRDLYNNFKALFDLMWKLLPEVEQ